MNANLSVLAGMVTALISGFAMVPASALSQECCGESQEICASAPSCGSPTGSSCCGTADFIPHDPVTRPGERSRPHPHDLGLTDLESVLEPVRALFRIPGLAAAVIRNGELAALGTAGIRRVGSAQRLALEDPFHLGSCGKAITATVAAAMVDRGTIRWDTTIGEAFPELDPTTHSLYRDVTLRQLLSHRGGFDARTDIFDQAISNFPGTMPEQRLELVRYSVGNVPAVRPGSAFNYSDIGYSVAGAMLGRASGQAWEDLVDEMLADPLGLETLGFGAPGLEDPDAAPRGHLLQGSKLVALGTGPREDLANPAIGPAGTIHMSMQDWATFASLHLKGARGESTELLSPSAFDALHGDPFEQGYGLGWFLTANEWGEGTALTHTGSCGAWSALIWILPEANAAILVATNYGGGSGYRALQLAADRIGTELLSRSPSATSGDVQEPSTP